MSLESQLDLISRGWSGAVAHEVLPVARCVSKYACFDFEFVVCVIFLGKIVTKCMIFVRKSCKIVN